MDISRQIPHGHIDVERVIGTFKILKTLSSFFPISHVNLLIFVDLIVDKLVLFPHSR